MPRIALILWLLTAPAAYSARCQLLVKEAGSLAAPRAVVDLSRIADPGLGPSIVILNGKAMLLDDQFMESSASGVYSAPGEKLDLTIPSLRGREAIKKPLSVAIAPWDGKFIFFVVGENGSLQGFAPHRTEKRSYSATSIPKPKACKQREKLVAVKAFGFDHDIYLYVATNRGRIFRTVLNSNNGQKPDEKWEVVAENAGPHFAVLGLSDFAYLDRLGSLYLQQGKKVEWLGHFRGAVSSFSAHLVPRQYSTYSQVADRLTVWMTAYDGGLTSLYRWHTLAALRKPRIIRPMSMAPEVPVAVSSVHEDSGRLQERVMVLTARADGGEPRPFNIHMQTNDTWASPEWWQEEAPKPRRIRPTYRRRVMHDTSDAVRRHANDPIPRLLTQFLAMSGASDPQALITAFRVCSFPVHREGNMPSLQVNDLALLAHVLTTTTEEAMSLIANTDLYKEFNSDNPTQARPGQKPFDTRTQDFPHHSRKWVVMAAVYGLGQHFLHYNDPWEMHRYLRDQLEAMPGYGQMEFWEFLNLAYDRLSIERKLEEDER